MATIDAPTKAGGREWAGLAVLCLPTRLMTIDLNVMLLALPHIAAELGATGVQQLWMTDIYGFLIAGLLITMGTVGDRIGRRRLLLIGAVAFIAASLLAAYSTSTAMLITAAGMIVITQANSSGLAILLRGLIIVYIGSGPIGTLIPFMVMSSAPREKAGTVGSLPGTVGEFGVALGVALLGLVGTAVYRAQVVVPAESDHAASESIAGAVATASHAPGPIATELVESAHEAFTSGLNIVATVAAAVLVGLAAVAAIGLRHVPTIGAASADSESPAEPEETAHSGS